MRLFLIVLLSCLLCGMAVGQDSLNVRKLGSVTLSGIPGELAVDSARAYVTYWGPGYAGLAIINVSNPAQPAYAGSATFQRPARGLDVRDSLAYVTLADSGLKILDVRSPFSPTVIGSCCGFSSYNPDEIIVGAAHAYLAYGEAGFVIVDITDPHDPAQVSQLYTQGIVGSVAIAGNYAYVAECEGYELAVVDIGNPQLPQRVGTYISPGCMSSIVVEGNYAYVGADSTLRVLDISTPSNPSEIGLYEFDEWIMDIAKREDCIFLSVWDDGLRILDVSDPTLPFEFGHYVHSDRWASRVAVSGNLAYVAEGYYPNSEDMVMSIYEYVSAGPHVMVEPPLLDFGLVAVGESASLPLAILSVGSDNLTVFEMIAPDGFATNFGSGDLVISPRDAVVLTITFSPVQPRNYADTLYIVSDALEGTVAVQVVGTSTPNAAENVPSPPRVFALHSTYPNPFNATTQIRFDVPHSSFVSVNVYDVQGRLVDELASHVFAAGTHSIAYDAGNRASGMYIVRLNSGEFSAAQKVLLVK